MDRIKNTNSRKMIIKYEKIKPFVNICKVTGVKELCNIEIEYVPNEYLIEIGSYRRYFELEFNEYIETLAESVFDYIDNLVQPKELTVRIYLVEPTLTEWNVTIKK